MACLLGGGDAYTCGQGTHGPDPDVVQSSRGADEESAVSVVGTTTDVGAMSSGALGRASGSYVNGEDSQGGCWHR